MPATFSTIVVPLDLEPEHDRSLPIARSLASVGNLPTVLLTVSSPGLPEFPDQADLRRAATRHRLANWSSVVLHDNHPARAIADYLATLDAPLLVMASRARGALSSLVSGSTSADLLSEIACAALVVGPNVADTWRPEHPQLLTCVAPTAPAHTAFPSITRWVNTFGGNPPRFVKVDPIPLQLLGAKPEEESAPVQALADEWSAVSGIRAGWEVLHDDDPVNGLLLFTESNQDAMLAVTSERWADHPRMLRHSVSRRLAHDSTKPVLVVPHVAVAAS